MARRSVVIASALLPALGFFAACGEDPVATPVEAGTDDAPLDVFADEPDVDRGPTKAIWVNTTDALFRFDPDTHGLTKVAAFGCAADLVFDIAVDESDRMFGVTSLGLVAIDPQTAACTAIAGGVYPHAIAFIPKGTVDFTREVLVGYNAAQYVRIDEATGTITPIGNMTTSGTG